MDNFELDDLIRRQDKQIKQISNLIKRSDVPLNLSSEREIREREFSEERQNLRKSRGW